MPTASVLSIVAGALVLLTALADILLTVFGTSSGAGPLSGRLAKAMWRMALRVHRPGSRRSHSLLRAAGPIIVFTIILSWVAALIVAWALFFVPGAFAEPGAVGLWDRLVFASKAILGRGGNSPALAASTTLWEVVRGFSGLSGVTMVTLALAYILPIRSAVVQKRTLALTISTLGKTERAMTRLKARAPEGGSVELHLIALVPMVALCVENHRAYPILHYFHSRDRRTSLALAVASLGLFLEQDHDDAPAIDRSVTEPLARALTSLFKELMALGLRERVDSAEEAVEQDRSALPSEAALRAYVEYDGWVWDRPSRTENGSAEQASRRAADEG